MKEYNRSLLEVSLRMLVFIIYYAAMISLGILMIVTTVAGTLVILPLLISGASGIVSAIFNLVTWVAFWFYIVMFAICFIKPLFLFTRSDAANQSIEVSREDCPKLFKIIDDVTSYAGTRMPKHVYVSEGVDARVFYETNFWSIFFPVRKNLKIGLDLLDGLSVEELKAILGHEFGHFSKEGKKFESTVYIINQVLYNLATATDLHDKWIDKWCHSSVLLFVFIGAFFRLHTSNIHHLNVIMYMFVYRSYQKLAKQMEYDADSASCHYIGSDTFVSAMHKVGINAKNKRFYQEVFDMLAAEKMVPANIYTATNIIKESLPSDNKSKIEDNDPLSSEQNSDRIESRINIENTWGFHSDTKERLRRAAALNIQVPHTSTIKAWGIIPEGISKKVSDLVINRVNEKGKIKTISDNDFNGWVHTYLEENFMPYSVRPYFGRDIMFYALKKNEMMPKESPFNDHNRHIIAEFLTAKRDWETLQKLQSGEIDVEYITYNGKITTIKNLPMEEHRKYFEKLANQVSYIDKWVISYLSDSFEDSLNKMNIRAYYYLANTTGSALRESLIPLYKYRNFIDQRIRSCKDRKKLPKQVEQEFIKYEEYYYQVISQVNLPFVVLEAGKEYAEDLEKLINDWKKGPPDVRAYYICKLDAIPKDLVRMYKYLSNIAKSGLRDLAQSIVEKNTVTGDDKQMNSDDSKMVGNISIKLTFVVKKLFRDFDSSSLFIMIFCVIAVLHFFIIIFFP